MPRASVSPCAPQTSNLMGCLTTYGIGSAPPYFGAGYVPQGDWLKVGQGGVNGVRGCAWVGH